MVATAKGRSPAGRAPAPGPRGHPILRNILDLRRDFIQSLMDGWRQFGDVVSFRAHVPLCLLAHPDHVKHVLLDHHRNYPKTPFVDNAWRQSVGEGLICSKGEFWLRQRRLAQPIFHRQRIAAFGTLMTETTAAMLDRWQDHAGRGEALDIRVEMTRLTLDILAKSLFSADWSREAAALGPVLTVQLERLYQRLEMPFDLPEWVPVPANRRLVAARRTLDEIVYRLIAERRRRSAELQFGGSDREVGATSSAGDLVSMLLQARDEETGESMSDRQVHDEVLTMIFGGHETVSTGLTWTWYLLSRHPAVARRLRLELDEVLGGRPPTFEDVDQLPYTAMVLEEAMRLYPPVWLISRTPLADDEIGGYHIPAGTMMLICPYVTHRHPEFWENPEGFDPERFTPERSASRHRYGYFPFSGGPRKCIGTVFGMVEMQLIVAMVAQRYRLDLVPGHPVVPQPGITLRARHGMLMTLEPLAASGDAKWQPKPERVTPAQAEAAGES